MKRSLGTPDIHYLSGAIGWFELGNMTEAKLELEKIQSAQRLHPSVLEVRWAIHAQEKNWALALQDARELLRQEPGAAVGWLHQSYALRRVPEGGGLLAAWEALLPAAARFPEEATVAYNLSCYACQLGRLEEARDWLRRAIKIAGQMRMTQMALADSDLEPLWSEIRAWKA